MSSWRNERAFGENAKRFEHASIRKQEGCESEKLGSMEEKEGNSGLLAVRVFGAS